MRGFAQPTTYVVTIMKNFLTALASALLVAVIVTSLHYFVFSNDLDRAPLALFILSFLGMAGVALFNVRLSALRSGIGAGVAAGAGAVTGSAVAKAGQNRGNSKQARGGAKNTGSSNRGGKDQRNAGGNAGGNAGRNGGGRGGKDSRSNDAGAKAPASAPASPTIPDGPRENGTVKWFNRSKGFGFIIRPNGEEIFVHHRSIRNADEARRSNLRDGQEVNYVVADHTKGQQAEDVVGE